MGEFATKWAIYLPVLIGAFMISLIQVGKRPLASSRVISPLQLLVAWFGMTAGLFLVIYLAIWGLTLPSTLPGFWAAVLGMTLAGVAIQYCNVQAATCQQGEVSLTAPLQAMTPGLITVLGIALGEFPGWRGLLGCGCMSVGSYILLWDGVPQHWYEYFGPFRYLGRLTHYHSLTAEQQSKTLAVCWSLGSASLGTVGLLFGGLFTRRGQSLQGLTLGALVEVAVYAFVYIGWYLTFPDTSNRSRSLREFKLFRSSKSFLLLVLIAGAWVAHMWLINPAYQQTYVAHVGTLKRLSVLFSVVLGLHLFREQMFKGSLWTIVIQPRFWAAVFTVLGVVLISADDLPTRITTQLESWGF